MEKHIFDVLIGILMAFFAGIGYTAISDGGSLVNSIVGVFGLFASGCFGVALLSQKMKAVQPVKKDVKIEK